MVGEVGDVVFEVRGLRCGRGVKDVSLRLYRGEVAGLAGLEDAGRSDLLEVLSGRARPACGEVLLGGRPVRFNQPWQAVLGGIAWLPADELPRLARLAIGDGDGVAMFAHWIEVLPSIVLLESPTAAMAELEKAAVRRFISKLTLGGKAVLVTSSDVSELLELSDRITVLHAGRVAGLLDRQAATREAIQQLASGAALISESQPASAGAVRFDRSWLGVEANPAAVGRLGS
nr:ATP-binding cassette domain-containing protein [Propionicimonas sp.]